MPSAHALPALAIHWIDLNGRECRLQCENGHLSAHLEHGSVEVWGHRCLHTQSAMPGAPEVKRHLENAHFSLVRTPCRIDWA